MCLRKLFPNWFPTDPIIPPPIYSEKTLLSFAINNWPGSENDLRGCLNDQKNVSLLTSKNYFDVLIKKWSDTLVTRELFREQLKYHFLQAKAGDEILIHYSGHGTYGLDPYSTEEDGYSEALYLYDGPFWDYEFTDLLKLIPDGVKVTIVLDSCFAKGATSKVVNYNKPRYMPIQDIKPGVKRKKAILVEDEMNYLLWAGCGERQTSADAYINGKYEGAFTHFWIESWIKGIPNYQWQNRLTQYLPSKEYDQIPSLIGKAERFNDSLFT